MRACALPLTLLTAAVGASLALVAPPTARAVGNATAELGAGGTAKGDISSQINEQDRIGVDLTVGEPIDIRFHAGFAASLSLYDPMGTPIQTEFSDGAHNLTQKSWVAPATGRFEFRISSFDGSQGTYKLRATPAWAQTIRLSAAPLQNIELPMPANSAITALFKGRTVTVNSFVAPNSTVLISDLAGGTKSIKVPKTDCDTSGVYSMDVSAATGDVTGTITRILPKFSALKPNLTNGLDQVSFAKSGLDDYFRARCGNCHFWGSGYAGVRAYARDSLARMRSGNMPKGGTAPNDTIALLDQWIKTGYGR